MHAPREYPPHVQLQSIAHTTCHSAPDPYPQHSWEVARTSNWDIAEAHHHAILTPLGLKHGVDKFHWIFPKPKEGETDAIPWVSRKLEAVTLMNRADSRFHDQRLRKIERAEYAPMHSLTTAMRVKTEEVNALNAKYSSLLKNQEQLLEEIKNLSHA